MNEMFNVSGVFEGLRKIVGVKNDFSASVEHLSDCRSESAVDIIAPLTSPILRSTNKRKVDGDVINSGFSIKKKYLIFFVTEIGKFLTCLYLFQESDCGWHNSG